MAVPEVYVPGNCWSERYEALLAASGLNARTILNGALQPASGERRGLFSLAQCLEQPAILTQQIMQDYPETGGRQAVRAHVSVLQQDLALSVIAPLTLKLFRDGAAPLPNPDRIFLAPMGNADAGVTGRWFQVPGEPVVDEAVFVRTVGRLTATWYPVFRHELGVSPGAYWSSIGLGVGAPFSAVWNLAEPEALCAQAQAWLAMFRNDTNRFIDWIPAIFGDQQTAIPQRKGCCLKYLLPGGGYCGTCGIYRKQRLADLNRQSSTQALHR